MARRYAAALGFLAFAAVLLRGALSGSSWESAVGFATASLCGFAVLLRDCGTMVKESWKKPFAAGWQWYGRPRLPRQPSQERGREVNTDRFRGRKGSVAAVKN